MHPCTRIFRIDRNGVRRAQPLRDFKAVFITRQTDNDDIFCARGFCGYNAAAALLSGSEHHQRFTGANACIQECPLKSVSKRQRHGGDMRWNVARQPV